MGILLDELVVVVEITKKDCNSFMDLGVVYDAISAALHGPVAI